MTADRKQPRTHAGEGIEDGVNMIGVVAWLLGVVALALALVAGGYGFVGWAVVAGIACVALCSVGAAVFAIEWHRTHRRGRGHSNHTVRQGH
ncbi:hypothetical protein VMT65_30920 [Nocardia sp. CDC153]|uniref:hypothetical protein n=1 Tax=Nocardia sp. CDC153 TaxID=3112167 RepID=UPI002DB86A3D|nr:hypothetical protein [Nocardia sp. CDC153]MEC3957481.1 hypothetical protein [Nocardia sp. CDC153]